VISALSYPVELGPAKDSAQRLFDFLQGLSGPGGTPIMVRLVAHSLGCRLALELLRRFAVSLKATQVVFASVSLMAAAVPVGKADESGEFGPVIQALRTQVLYSTDDRVLQLAFPIGETAALDGLFPQAVGRHGHPEVWSIPGARMNYAHGDYWPGKESSAAVVAFMGGPVHLLPGVNSIPVNQTLTSEDIPGRNLPPAGSIIETGIFG
jgi:pimeloyl-ACP methyl ester carboxylesterase